MPLYFAAVLANVDGGWTGREVDMTAVEDLDTLVETMRDVADGGTALFVLEEDDEYLALARVDGDGDPRTFISDERAVRTSPLAALVMEELAADEVEEDEEEGTRPDPEPAGDADLVTDLGIDGDRLVELCGEEGMLPADVMSVICEKAGCLDVLDELRGT